MNHKNVEIYVFHYKQGKAITNIPCYIQIWAGKNKSQQPGSFSGDDSGINISFKNKYYSELTGLYWVWKNTRQNIVGSMHYRRFLTNCNEPFRYRLKRFLYIVLGISKKRYGLIYTKNISDFAPLILNETQTRQLLVQYDIILPQARELKYTVKEHYKRYHQFSDLELLRSIIMEKHPLYLETFDKVMDGDRLYANNMFVMNRENFDTCMEWLFGLLFEFESRINLSDYTGYQERIMGFLAERLLTVWFLHSKLRIKELPVIYFKHLKYA